MLLQSVCVAPRAAFELPALPWPIVSGAGAAAPRIAAPARCAHAQTARMAHRRRPHALFAPNGRCLLPRLTLPLPPPLPLSAGRPGAQDVQGELGFCVVCLGVAFTWTSTRWRTVARRARAAEAAPAGGRRPAAPPPHRAATPPPPSLSLAVSQPHHLPLLTLLPLLPPPRPPAENPGVPLGQAPRRVRHQPQQPDQGQGPGGPEHRGGDAQDLERRQAHPRVQQRRPGGRGKGAGGEAQQPWQPAAL
jgi:hypothetical protein